MNIEYKILRGEQIAHVIEPIVRLRMEVFAAFPYLYEGDWEAERAYIGEYSSSRRSAAVVAYVDGSVVGAATLQPFNEAEEAMRSPIEASGVDITNYGYIGEMLLFDEHRGCGIGREMMRFSMEYMHEQGFSHVVVNVVDRAEDHPLRPEGYVHVCEKFSSVGFVEMPTMQSYVEWRQVDSHRTERNSLTCWIKSL